MTLAPSDPLIPWNPRVADGTRGFHGIKGSEVSLEKSRESPLDRPSPLASIATTRRKSAMFGGHLRDGGWEY
jgi:hypothetical protein